MSIKAGLRGGFTLIELLLFIVIVGAGMAGIAATYEVVVRSSADVIAPKQAMLVAESLLEEVLLKPTVAPAGGYDANCPAVCDRLQFDDVSDYERYTSAGVFSLDDMNTPIAGLENYQVRVNAAPVTASAAANAATGWRIDVSVETAAETYTLSGYRFNYE